MSQTCFVVMPFSEPFNSYYENVLKPAIVEAGLNPVRADEIYSAKPIIHDIIELIVDSKIIIADVTTKNPNVNYELGFAHALEKPAIIISQNINDVPFDYRHIRTIVYDTSQEKWESSLKDVLIKTIEAVLANPESCSVLAFLKKPKSQETNPGVREEYRLSYGDSPAKATFIGFGHFVLLKARTGSIATYMTKATLEVISDIQKLQKQLDDKESIQLRGIFFDDKHGSMLVYVDLIYDYTVAPSLDEGSLEEAFSDIYLGQAVSIEPVIIKTDIDADDFDRNSEKYYKRLREGYFR